MCTLTPAFVCHGVCVIRFLGLGVCIWESVLSFCLIFEAGSLLASSTLVTPG